MSEGDLVIADDSGVVFVPADRAEEVLAAAEAIVEREAAISADIRAGVRIDQAMRDARLAGHTDSEQEPHQEPGEGVLSTHASEVLAELPTASISDALDKLGLTGSVHGISPLRPGQRACGPAYTVAYEAVDDQGGTVGDFLDDVAPGSVVVIDNDGRTDCTVWGGIMTRAAAARGIAGTVIHGTCRDVPSILDVDYPMWSTARFMRTGKDRVQLRAVQVPLLVDGVTIHPGDWVCADADGALVVPADRVHDVIEAAQRIERTEEAITNAVLAGSHPDPGPRHPRLPRPADHHRATPRRPPHHHRRPRERGPRVPGAPPPPATRPEVTPAPPCMRPPSSPSPSTRASRPRGPGPACARPLHSAGQRRGQPRLTTPSSSRPSAPCWS